TRFSRDWSSDVCSSDLDAENLGWPREPPAQPLECAMQTLHPEIKPYARHELAVEAPHVLYVDESGSPDGLPVLFVHGGPGGGCEIGRASCRGRGCASGG